VKNVLGGPLPDLSVAGDGDLHRSEPERVVLGALDRFPRDALPPGFLPDLPDQLGPLHIVPSRAVLIFDFKGVLEPYCIAG
jgi:hypothetical protein